MNYTYGLIGKVLGYSFSKGYFTEKFKELKLTAAYGNFELDDISDFPLMLKDNPSLRGLNVTIPYKQAIMPYLDVILPEAQAIGAVNTIKITEKGLYGFNSDVHGFSSDLNILLGEEIVSHAMILGTGGASRAVHYAFKQILKVPNLLFVSRKGDRSFLGERVVSYDDLLELPKDWFEMVVNTTPLGTYPNVEEVVDIPFERFAELGSFAYDLVYNPSETAFMKKASQFGAKVRNGHGMLIGQAEKSWEFWQSFEPI
ncbi:MAG: shikimate dehydrogenase [Bacteroidota bacterium]